MRSRNSCGALPCAQISRGRSGFGPKPTKSNRTINGGTAFASVRARSFARAISVSSHGGTSVTWRFLPSIHRTGRFAYCLLHPLMRAARSWEIGMPIKTRFAEFVFKLVNYSMPTTIKNRSLLPLFFNQRIDFLLFFRVSCADHGI